MRAGLAAGLSPMDGDGLGSGVIAGGMSRPLSRLRRCFLGVLVRLGDGELTGDDWLNRSLGWGDSTEPEAAENFLGVRL